MITIGKTSFNNYYALKWLFKIAPGYFIYSLLFSLLKEICVLVEHTFLVAYIIECIELERPISALIPIFVVITTLIVLRFMVGPIVNSYFKPRINEKINQVIKMELYKKAISVDVLKCDDPEFYNDFVWAVSDAPRYVKQALKSLSSLLNIVVTTIFVGFYMAFSDIVGLLFVLVSVLLTFLCRMFINKKQIELEKTNLPYQRKMDYVGRVFYLSQYVKDLKTSDMGKILREDYRKATIEKSKLVKEKGKKIAILDFLGAVFQKVITFDGFYITYLLIRLFYFHSFNYGTLVALYNSANKMKSSIQGFVDIIPSFQQNSLHIEKIILFLSMENELDDEGECCVPNTGEISFHNVSFRYPRDQEDVLKNICLNIKAGERVALVGHNGAGKTTLVKLILRLYDPLCGEVCFGGRNLKRYPLREYRKRLSAIFQNYELYATSLEKNITMSNSDLDKEKTIKLFEDVDFIDRYNSLPDKFETILTKEFDSNGINLSGGEGQKVALVRALYSNASIMIFDEPSSALDPISESKFNKMIVNIARDRTVIIITHRLSTTKFVDRIVMMEDGKIIETGTHDELMKKAGQYHKMYQLQASKYKKA